MEREFEMPAPLEIKVLENGAERGIVRIVRKYQNSLITQDIILYARSPRIDFRTEIDWKEHSQVLKTEFQVNVNVVKATYEIQFGHIERPTTRNTLWEEAKFEVCAHKWADVSDGGYGLALMNDCKYGYSADNSVQEILPERFSMFSCRNAVLETVKPAEDGDGFVIRMYETYNRTEIVQIFSCLPIKRAEKCDLLERIQKDGVSLNMETDGGVLFFLIRPFEIVTLRIWLNTKEKYS